MDAPTGGLDELVLKQSELFLKLHERALESTASEAKSLAGLLRKHGLPDGGTILDAPCGVGPHAVHLAGLGYRVDGLDPSQRFIEVATAVGGKLGIQSNLSLKVGDLRTVGKAFTDRTFDAAISMWQSLGSWDDATDLSILKQFHDVTTERGLLGVDLVNRDFLVKHMTNFGVTRYEDGTELHEMRRLNYETSDLELIWDFYRQEGEDLKHRTTAKMRWRVRSLHELRALLQRAGWEPQEEFGSFDLDPVTVDMRRLLVICSKA